MFSSPIRLNSITRLDKKFILHNTFETCCKTEGKNIVLRYIGNVLELYAYFHVFCVFVLCKKFCNCLYCCFSGRICLFFFWTSWPKFLCMFDILLLQTHVTSILGRYPIFSILYNKSLSIKSYIYISRGLCASCFRDTNRVFKFKPWWYVWVEMIWGKIDNLIWQKTQKGNF